MGTDAPVCIYGHVPVLRKSVGWAVDFESNLEKIRNMAIYDPKWGWNPPGRFQQEKAWSEVVTKYVHACLYWYEAFAHGQHQCIEWQ